jgi:hypothetical protein
MIDILTTERYLPPRTQLKIELERGSTTMCLLSPNQDLNLKIQILEINMSVRRFTPSATISLQNEKRFLGGAGFILPVTRSTIRYRTLHAGVLTTCVPSLLEYRKMGFRYHKNLFRLVLQTGLLEGHLHIL